MFAHPHLTILSAPFLALAALLLLLLSIASAAGIRAQEAALNPADLAYEVNRTTAGTYGSATMAPRGSGRSARQPAPIPPITGCRT